MKSIEERLEALEKAVFTHVAAKEEKELHSTPFSKRVENFISENTERFSASSIMHVSANLHKESSKSTIQMTSIDDVIDDESDEDLLALCSAFSSKIRVSIVRSLAKEQASSGELSERLALQGGHLHHHLKELIRTGFVKKDNSGNYHLTDHGYDAFLTLGALNRRLRYER